MTWIPCGCNCPPVPPPTPFAPTDVEGCKLWLRADLGVTAPGNKVSAWADQSGNGNDCAQVDPLQQPTLVPAPSGGANNQAYIDFPTAGLDLINALMANAAPLEWFGVARFTDDTGEPFIFGFDATGTELTFFAVDAANIWGYSAGLLGAEVPFANLNVDAIYDAAYGTAVQLFGAAIAINGGPETLMCGGNRAATTGYVVSPTIESMVGFVYEIIVYNNTIGAIDKGKLISYLKARYAL